MGSAGTLQKGAVDLWPWIWGLSARTLKVSPLSKMEVEKSSYEARSGEGHFTAPVLPAISALIDS